MKTLKINVALTVEILHKVTNTFHENMYILSKAYCNL